MIRARAPLFVGDRRVTLVERDYPGPGPGQLLLSVVANALCGSERQQYLQGAPVVAGHEAAGVVVAAGAHTATPLGTAGVVYLMDYCGRCRSCGAGRTNICLAKRRDMGFTADGGYGPFELVSESQFFAVPDEINAVESTLLLDVMGTSGHALTRLRQCCHDVASLLVTGAGPIGLATLVMAKIVVGPDLPVYVCDVSQWRLALAEELGGIALDVSASAVDAVPRAVDAAVDTAGTRNARDLCIESLGVGGVLVCVGHGESLTVDVSRDLIAPERTVMGSEYFSYGEFRDNLALLLQFRARLARVITHQLPIEQLADAFELFLSGNAGKVVVTRERPSAAELERLAASGVAHAAAGEQR